MLGEIFDLDRIKLDLESTTKDDVFGELVGTIATSDSRLDHQELLEAVTFRESKMNTLIRPGIAVPHGYSNSVSGIVGAMGFSRLGIEYDNVNRNPVHLFFLLLMDESSCEQHLRVLGRLLEMIHSPGFAGICGEDTPREIYDLVCRY